MLVRYDVYSNERSEQNYQLGNHSNDWLVFITDQRTCNCEDCLEGQSRQRHYESYKVSN